MFGILKFNLPVLLGRFTPAILAYIFEKFVSRRKGRFTFTIRIINFFINKMNIIYTIVIITTFISAFILIRSRILLKKIIIFKGIIFRRVVLIRFYRLVVVVIKVFIYIFSSLIYSLGR